MFDIYSLAKPRVFKGAYENGGSGIPAPETAEYDYIKEQTPAIPVDVAEGFNHPEAAGRITVDNNGPESGRGYTLNMKTAFEDLGAVAVEYRNAPVSSEGGYRTEFRPKQGLHNLDFTTGENPTPSR